MLHDSFHELATSTLVDVNGILLNGSFCNSPTFFLYNSIKTATHSYCLTARAIVFPYMSCLLLHSLYEVYMKSQPPTIVRWPI